MVKAAGKPTPENHKFLRLRRDPVPSQRGNIICTLTFPKITNCERDMTLRPKIRANSSYTSYKQLSGAQVHLAPIRPAFQCHVTRTGRFSQVETATGITRATSPTGDLSRLLQLRFNRFDDFFSNSPSRVQATPLSCR